MSTIPGLSSVDDILDSDLVMITHANGQSFKILGSDINKRNQVVIASNTTLTGAPLKTGNIVRAYFTADLVAANSSTALSLSYNSVSYPVKVPKDGALVNYTPFEVAENTYKYLQAYTTLELIYDGTNFIVLGNPVIISGSGFNIHADGSGKVNEVAVNDMKSVTSNIVAKILSYFTTEQKTGGVWIDGKPIYRTCFICSSSSSISADGWINARNAFTGTEAIAQSISSLIDIDIMLNSVYPFIVCGALSSTPVDIALYNPLSTAIPLTAGSTVLIIEYTKTTD